MQNEEKSGPYCTDRVEEVESVERADRTTANSPMKNAAWGA
jgi:hypothetical protein